MNPEIQVVVEVSPENTRRVLVLYARQGQRHIEIFWTSLFGGMCVLNWIELT